MRKTIKTTNKFFSIMLKLQTHYHVKSYSQKVDRRTRGKWLIHEPNTARTISAKAWNSPVDYPSRECKHDIKESEGNVYNPIFKENVLGRNIHDISTLGSVFI